MIVNAKMTLIGITILAAGACQTAPRPATPLPDADMDVRRTMIDGINPAALVIWDVSNNAVTEAGAPDASKLDARTLARLREAAHILVTYAGILAEAPELRASGPDLVGDRLPAGVASREQIQAAIDANPAGFRAYSRAMGAEAEGILKAIGAGDRAAVAERLVSFDGACQSCHERYWYVST